MSIVHFNDFCEMKTYTVYFKFDHSFSSVSGIFTGFLYLENNECVRDENASNETIANGPSGVWIDDEPILFDEISLVENVENGY